ncbi:DUF1343 domain-containing protein [Trichlorobacter sp.]|uniref:exo-beta-N-acetylmuramidase NamZ family protein n=1 Tax=Trichlorobacter sp. TaxID=2911007 RepID=UPI002A35FC85|nr:DUF1343 domain-containing protein [Trichlorobacter sp.]MDY0383225.1 DUF1343 domain-containing protein [Trichlorobacter sp.]
MTLPSSALRIIMLALLLCCSMFQHASAQVLPGIDILAQRNFDLLQGKRVGLITNQTGRSTSGSSTIDLLATAPNVELVTLFSPEHGIRGEADVKIDSGVDQVTGLSIHSLYGTSCRPTPEMLTGIELLVFDIQDIGARFYTYIGTLHHALRAAKTHGIPLVVLDRPNPIGGSDLAGALPDPAEIAQRLATDSSGCRSLTITHPIPTRHGLTIGELARLINHQAGIEADLQVVPMSGWQREMTWHQTGLPWVNPSPNMKDPRAALLYPGLGILEATNLSVARGTDFPFHRYGAPWVDPVAVLKQLPSLPGFWFSPTSFTPSAPGHPYRDQLCHGIQITVSNPDAADPILAGLHLVQAIYRAHPDHYRAHSGFHSMVGDRSVWQRLTAGGESPEQVISGWQQHLEQFKQLREQYLLYI